MQVSQRTLVAAVVAGVAAFVLHSLYVRRLEGRLLSQYGDRQRVLVTTQEVPEGSVIRETQLTVREMPREFVEPGALSDVKEAVDATTLAPLQAGEQVLKNKLASGTAAGLSLFVKSGMRAYGVAVDDVTGVSGLLRPGDRVDVLGTFLLGTGSDRATVNRVLLQNATVLAVGDQISRSGIGAQQASRQKLLPSELDRPTSLNIKSITLQVTLEDAQRLGLAQETGVLAVALRSALDQSAEDKNRKQIDTSAIVEGRVATEVRPPHYQGWTTDRELTAR